MCQLMMLGMGGKETKNWDPRLPSNIWNLKPRKVQPDFCSQQHGTGQRSNGKLESFWSTSKLLIVTSTERVLVQFHRSGTYSHGHAHIS